MNRTSHYVSFFAAVAGMALLGYLWRQTGMSTVIQAVRLLGAGFLILLILSGIRHCLRAIAWRCCVDPDAHPQRFVDLFILRLMGESITDLSPAGPFLGESVKIWAVSKSISAKFGVTSVVIEDLLYSIGTTLFVLTGFLILLVSTAHRHNFVMPGGVIILLALAMIIFAIIVQQSHLLGRPYRRILNTSRGQTL